MNHSKLFLIGQLMTSCTADHIQTERLKGFAAESGIQSLHISANSFLSMQTCQKCHNLQGLCALAGRCCCRCLRGPERAGPYQPSVAIGNDLPLFTASCLDIVIGIEVALFAFGHASVRFSFLAGAPLPNTLTALLSLFERCSLSAYSCASFKMLLGAGFYLHRRLLC